MRVYRREPGDFRGHREFVPTVVENVEGLRPPIGAGKERVREAVVHLVHGSCAPELVIRDEYVVAVREEGSSNYRPPKLEAGACSLLEDLHEGEHRATRLVPVLGPPGITMRVMPGGRVDNHLERGPVSRFDDFSGHWRIQGDSVEGQEFQREGLVDRVQGVSFVDVGSVFGLDLAEEPVDCLASHNHVVDSQGAAVRRI
jgi:hypothetical protein